jgi:hypothetical protein
VNRNALEPASNGVTAGLTRAIAIGNFRVRRQDLSPSRLQRSPDSASTHPPRSLAIGAGSTGKEKAMQVQTDLRAGDGRRHRCQCGRSFLTVEEVNVHVLTFNGNGFFNHYYEGDAG